MGIHIKKTDSGKACVYLPLNAIVVRFNHLDKTIKGGGRRRDRDESADVERGVDKGFDCLKIRLCLVGCTYKTYGKRDCKGNRA